jgi:hypothetical protein
MGLDSGTDLGRRPKSYGCTPHVPREDWAIPTPPHLAASFGRDPCFRPQAR